MLSALALPVHGASRPDSRIRGVQIGAITYSFREMKDQSAEAMLRYCLDSGISAIELMGDAAEQYAGLPANPNLDRLIQFMQAHGPLPGMGGPPPDPHQAPLTTEQQHERVELLASQRNFEQQAVTWREHASMDKFVQLRKLFNSAGVSIYGFKPSVFEVGSTDGEVDYGLRAGRALGASHVTVELPAELAQAKRLGDAAAKHGMKMAYHAHTQATPTAWDAALAVSAGNAINLDLGHFTAAGDFDGIAFIQKHHQRIASMHLKDRKNKANGGANMVWGEGDTPLAQALRLMRDQHYQFPASVELEYPVPAGSDAVKEVARCLQFCRRSLI